MRGEYFLRGKKIVMKEELPPRARRIHLRRPQKIALIGTTSACAENTYHGHTVGLANGNYLRVRGEYACPQCDAVKKWELPPRARRIRLLQNLNHSILGTTSACAENTPEMWPNAVAAGNYLRVRGEYLGG